MEHAENKPEKNAQARVPAELHQQVAEKLVRDNLSMQQLIRDALQAYVDGNRIKAPEEVADAALGRRVRLFLETLNDDGKPASQELRKFILTLLEQFDK